MSKSGEAWIESPQKRVLEIALISPLVPAAGSIALADRARQTIYEAERSHFPGSSFMTKKFGDPTRDSFVHRWLRRTMVDELPQLLDVLDGSMTLIGPRADSPAHIEALFEAVRDENPDLHDEWKEVRFNQKPGIISSYAVHSHRNNLEGAAESERFSDVKVVAGNARLRAELDVADFHAASMGHDLRLVAATGAMAARNYGHYITHLMTPNSRPIDTEVPVQQTTKPLE